MQVSLHRSQKNSYLHATVQMKGSPDRIAVCTTTYFDGIIAVIDPEKSWVSRWQRTCESSIRINSADSHPLFLLKQNMLEECMLSASKVAFPRT